MKRHTITPRPHWQDTLERMGFDYHSIDGSYWQENAYYAFSADQIEVLETATNELHALCLEVVADIVKSGDYERLALNDIQARLAETSFRASDPLLYGRFDLAYDGINAPKLLEYNADTPTALFEASVAQWYWLKDRTELANADQFNSIHEQLILAWAELKNLGIHNIYFATEKEYSEDVLTCRYLQDTAIQAGLKTWFLDLKDIGVLTNGGHNSFVDLNNQTIAHIFKLYPWEWLSVEYFGQYIMNANTKWIEPAYKLLLSNKAILPLLWEKFPNHPNLLPCYFELDKLKNHTHHYAKKPIFSREGANITLFNGEYQNTIGDYGNEGYVYQSYYPLPKFVNNIGKAVYPVIGSWVISHSSAGIGIREDFGLITKDTSLFVPHLFY